MKSGLILVGGGGHCHSCIDVIESEGKHSIVGILDAKEAIGSKIFGYPILGDDELIPRLVSEGNQFIITLGQIKTATHRVRLFKILKSLGAIFTSAVSPLAYVSKRASVGDGTVIMHQAVVNAGSTVGANCIINTRALIEHDAAVGSHCHISTGATLNGGALVSDCVFVGSQATLLQQVSIPTNCVIGAGGVVRKSIQESGTYVGDPLRKVRSA